MHSKKHYRKLVSQPGLTHCDGFSLPFQGVEICVLTATFEILLSKVEEHKFEAASPEELTQYFATTCLTESGMEELKKITKRVGVAHRLLTQGNLAEDQDFNIFDGLYNAIAPLAFDMMKHYRTHAEEAHRACEELLQTNVKPQQPAKQTLVATGDDEKLCICCLDSPRSLVYRPCNHRVCCEECAVALWAKAQTCPWCRGSCEDFQA